MTSKDETVESIIECSSKIDLPIWLSISCAMNNEKRKLMLSKLKNLNFQEVYLKYKLMLLV